MRLRAAKHKYGAKRVTRNEIKFPSKLEGDCYSLLNSLKESGKILFFLRQIPIDLQGGVKHVVDFMAFTNTEVYFIESKGRDLPLSVLKRKQSEERLGVQIHVVHKPEEILSVLFPA